MRLVCPRCSKEYPANKPRYLCDCGSVMLVEHDKLKWAPKGEGIWRYSTCLPPVKEKLKLDEGNTPLVRGRDRPAWYKLEGDNPTGSFKDRGTALVVSKAVGDGYKRVCVASTGNMGASVAAYAAYANITAQVFVPAATPAGKLSQIIAYGAELHKVNGTFHDAVEQAMLAATGGSYLAMTGLNPYYIEGEKTLGYELFEEIGVPDNIIVPMGTGGLLTAIYKSFVELKRMKKTKDLPRMIGVQAENCSPITDAFISGANRAERVEHGDTIASAIMVKTPFNDLTALQAIRESGGKALSVTESSIKTSILTLGKEGVFAEPASATTLAAWEQIGHSKGEKTVLVVTGSGLKQPDAFSQP